jgi:hypothetical protein
MRSHSSAYIRPPPNPNRRRKSESERRNQTNQTNVERRSQPTQLGATRKRSSRTTERYWLVFPRLRSTSTKQTKHPAGTVDEIATTR